MAFRPLFLAALSLLSSFASARGQELLGIDNPLHGYFTTPPQDRFSRWLAQFEAGRRKLDTRSDLVLLQDLLGQLEVPVASQMLVYSVTSLQKELVSPRRPRALYFNDDTYVAYVPGGRVEVISLDPALGSIFYISDRIRRGQTPRLERSEECMNCHAPHHLEHIPALMLQSVVPGPTGGGERAFRREETGHGIPLALRFGGWHLTGTGDTFPANWGNKLIERHDGVASEVALPIGERCDLARYLLPTSDVLPQLIQEHQVGFVNRALQANYRARELAQNPGGLAAQASAVESLAAPLVRYLLFADEVALPPGSVPGDADFATAFLRNRRADGDGASLKDLDLTTRLFRHRCSYMIYTPTFTGLLPELKTAVLRQLARALADAAPAEYAYLSLTERRRIRSILRATLPEGAAFGLP